jgi:hypothetical protein
MTDDRKGTPSTLWEGLGRIAGLLAGDLGRVIAVVGGLLTGFTALSTAWDLPRPERWPLLTVAGATFGALAWACGRPIVRSGGPH